MANGWQDTRIDVAVMKGGLNLAAPMLALGSGEAIQLHNYEVDEYGRYKRIEGYERFDGHPRPGDQPFHTLTVVDASGFAVNGVVTGGTSGATGRVVSISLPDNQLALVDLAGNFVEGETVGGTTAVAPALRNYALTPAAEAQFGQATAEYFRQHIGIVPGSGPIRGLALYRGKLYAFRNNADATACVMFVESPTGWQQVTTPALLPGGQYKFRVHNFEGQAGNQLLVGVDGVNKAFVFDGTTLTQITTGMPDDKPVCLEALPSNVLLLGYSGGSLLVSALGDPLDYQVANGAGEMAVGDGILDLDLQPNNTVAVFCKTSLKILYGQVKSDLQLTTLDNTLTLRENSVMPLGDSVFATESGVSRLTRIQQFGDYDTLTASAKVKPLYDLLKNRVTAAFAVRNKGQYRLCFDNRLMLICTFSGAEPLGFSTADYGLIVRCTCHGRGAAGGEEIYFGSDDGYVYQADKGWTFDGRSVKSVVRPAFNFLKSPEHRKRFKKLSIEIETPTQVDFRVLADLDYAADYTQEALLSEFLSASGDLMTAYGGASYFDDSGWGESRWSTAVSWVTEVYITGVGQRISPCVISESVFSPPHVLNSITLHWSPRTRKR